MDRKIKNTLVLLLIFVVISLAGGIYSFVYQSGKIDDREKKLENLRRTEYDTEELKAQLADLKRKAAELDSILALRKYNIPVDLKQSRFYDFVNKISFEFSPLSHVDIIYENLVRQTHFNFYRYMVRGIATYNDFYKLVYGIEQSKQLKKVDSVAVKDFVEVDDEGFPHYLVSFEMKALVYFSDNDRFASSDYRENKLTPNRMYNIFYPLIREEIPPNTENLLDVQNAELLALIPDGAYISDGKGNTYLIWEGDEVYLGYCTEIDYKNDEVSFIINKGGIVEKITLKLGQKKSESIK